MAEFCDVQQFVREANRIACLADLETLLVGMVELLGFDHVALVHHFSLHASSTEAVEVLNYPQAWQDLIVDRGYFTDDPILRACQSSATAFRWSDVENIISLSQRQRDILDSAGTCGLGEGFTVPVVVPGEFLGSCSFGVRDGRAFPEAMLPAAQYVGCFAFEAARRIQNARRDAPGRSRNGDRPRLTPRQFDCLVLAAQGRSDWHIGQLLGISQLTAHQHIEDAKRRYGVASRVQLIVRALFDNQISFRDTIG
jgi:LuxR family transcriptional regulator, quorum-sensing system regulator CciR